MATINDLPNEILAKIFGFCPSTQHCVIRLENVSKKWRAVVEKYLGVFLIAGIESTMEIKEVKGNSRIRVFDHCFKKSNVFKDIETAVAEMHVSDPEEETMPPQSPSDHGDGNTNTPLLLASFQECLKKLSEQVEPDYVKKVCFIGNIPIQVPAAFLAMCKNLTGLHFHLSSMIGIDPTIQLAMDIPTLRTFVIDSYALHWLWNISKSTTKMNHVLDIALGFLKQNTFPRLQSLIVDIPLCSEKENAIVLAISTFLGRHHASIQSFCYHQGFVVSNNSQDSDDEDILVEDENQASQTIFEILATSYAALKQVSLKELHIGLYSPQESDQLWTNLMIQQTKLEKMIFTGKGIHFPGITVLVNQATLTTLIMEVKDNVDCENLKGCFHLKNLSLLGKNEEDGDEEDEISEINIFNLELVSVQLESLRINCLKIDRRSISEIICSGRWIHLQQLELIDCGIEGNDGVPIQAIAHIFEKQSLKWFQIDKSLNRKSLEERNTPQSIKLLMYALRNNSISRFTIQGHFNSMMGTYEIFPPFDKPLENAEIDVFQFPEEIDATGSSRLKTEKRKDVNEHSDSESSAEENGSNNSYDLPSDVDVDMNVDF